MHDINQLETNFDGLFSSNSAILSELEKMAFILVNDKLLCLLPASEVLKFTQSEKICSQKLLDQLFADPYIQELRGPQSVSIIAGKIGVEYPLNFEKIPFALFLWHLLERFEFSHPIFSDLFTGYAFPRENLPGINRHIRDLLESVQSFKAVAMLSSEFIESLTNDSADVANMGFSQKGFHLQYENTHQALDHYVDHVRHEIIHELNLKNRVEAHYYALYFALVQSSGYGKSRMVLEAGKRHLNTVYGCVRATSSTGYPAANETLFWFLKIHNNVEELKKILSIIYLVAVDYMKNNNNADNGLLPLANLMGASNRFESFWQMVMQAYDARLYPDCVKLFKESQARFSLLRKDHQPSRGMLNGEVPSELVVVIDEAKSLLGRDLTDPMDDGSKSIFHNLRRALRSLESKNMVLVLVDTHSSITNFAPATSLDSPNRPCRPGHHFHLLPPFYEVLTYDVLRVALEQLENGQDFANWDHYGAIFSQGRPMWKALYLNCKYCTGDEISQLVHFARRKLSNNERMQLKDDVSKIALIAVRCGVEGVVDHHLASALVSSHMGTGIYIDDDRLRMVVQYPAEPVLGEAACQNLYMDHERCFMFSPKKVQDMLSIFISKCVSKHISAGTVGGIIARCILSLSYDHAVLKRIGKKPVEQLYIDSLFSRPVTVKQFLDSLISAAYKDEFQSQFGMAPPMLESKFLDSFGTGLISFTNWMCLEDFDWKMTGSQWQEFLNECFCKRVAVIMPLNQKELDLLIPIKFETCYSFALVKVNNRDDRVEVAGERLTPTSCFGTEFYPSLHFDCYDNTVLLESESASDRMTKTRLCNTTPQYLGLYMEIGTEQLTNSLKSVDKEEMVSFCTQYPSHLMLLGFDSTTISSMPALKSLFKLFCRRHVENVNLSERLPKLQVMKPLSYKFSEIPGCGCHGRCLSIKCGCRIAGKPCTEYCLCILNCDDEMNRCVNCS